MRRMVYFLIWINISFYTLCGFIEYSGRNYEIIHENKAELQISKPSDMNNQEFIETIIEICNDTQTDVFYETIQNAMNGHPAYSIYKTNVNKDFLSVPLKNKTSTILKEYESFSTNISENITDQIIGSSLLHDISIYEFHELMKYKLDHAIYYTNEEMVPMLTSALLAKHIDVTLIRNSSYVQIAPAWYSYRIILGVLLLIGMIFYYFCFKREIVIKKLTGYSNGDVLLEQAIRILKITMIGIIFNMVLIVVIMKLFWSSAVLDCMKYMVLGYLVCAVIALAEFLLASIYILSQSSAVDITGRTKNREIQVISILSKGIIVIFCMFELMGLINNVQRYIELSNHYVLMENDLENLYYLPFNTLSSDIDGNMDYYERQSMKLVNEISNIYKEDQILIIDASQYEIIESGNSKCDFITINKT